MVLIGYREVHPLPQVTEQQETIQRVPSVESDSNLVMIMLTPVTELIL